MKKRKTGAALNVNYMIKENISWKVVDGEAVLLNRTTGWYYSLSAVGTEIWKMLSQKKSLSQVITGISRKYRKNSDVIRKDVLALLKDLRKEDLVKVKA